MGEYNFSVKFKNMKKPVANLNRIHNRNILNLLSETRKYLKSYPLAFNEMRERILLCSGNYEEALDIVREYLEIE